jgi:hypothetical protein
MVTKIVSNKKQICKTRQISIFKFKSKTGKFRKMNKLEMDLSKASIWLYLTSMMETLGKKIIKLLSILIIFLRVAIIITFKTNWLIIIMNLFKLYMKLNLIFQNLLFPLKTIIKNALTLKALKNWKLIKWGLVTILKEIGKNGLLRQKK